MATSVSLTGAGSAVAAARLRSREVYVSASGRGGQQQQSSPSQSRDHQPPVLPPQTRQQRRRAAGVPAATSVLSAPSSHSSTRTHPPSVAFTPLSSHARRESSGGEELGLDQAKAEFNASPKEQKSATDGVVFDSITSALRDIANGKFVVVVDDEDRENEGDLIMAAEHVTTEKMAWMIRHTSGLVCIGMEGSRIDDLNLPPMVRTNTDNFSTAFTVSVDARETTTGISAADRATTVRRLAAQYTRADDFRRPGHMYPLRAKEGGVLVRPGHTEASVDLARLAGCVPAGILCELVDHTDGSMMRRQALYAFAKQHDLRIVTIRDLIAFRRQNGGGLEASTPTIVSARAEDKGLDADSSLLALAMAFFSSAASVMAATWAPAAQAAEEAAIGEPGFSVASYYTALGLFVLSLPGLWSLIKRASQAKIKRKTFQVPGPASPDSVPLDALAREISIFFIQSNYRVADAGEVITFEGNVAPSRGQAAFLTFCAFFGLASTALVLSIAQPDIGSAAYLITLASPLAGVYYWQRASRKDYVKVKMVTADDDSVTDVLVEGDEEEIDRMRKSLTLMEKDMIYVKGLFER